MRTGAKANYFAEVAAAARRTAPRVVSEQNLPQQEPGQRSARALSGRIEAEGASVDEGFRIDFLNSGNAGAVFAVYAKNSLASRGFYAVEPD